MLAFLLKIKTKKHARHPDSVAALYSRICELPEPLDGDPMLLAELHRRKMLLQGSLSTDFPRRPFLQANRLQAIKEQARGILELQQYLKWETKGLTGLLAEALHTKSLPLYRLEDPEAFATKAHALLAGPMVPSLRQAIDHVKTILIYVNDEVREECRPIDVMYARFEELAQALPTHKRNSSSLEAVSKLSDLNKYLSTIAHAISQRTHQIIIGRILTVISHVLIALKASCNKGVRPGSQSSFRFGDYFPTLDPLDQLRVWSLNISKPASSSQGYESQA